MNPTRKAAKVKAVRMWAALRDGDPLTYDALRPNRESALAWARGGRKMGYPYRTFAVLVTPLAPRRAGRGRR